ncbi:hypothetical protein [Roseateles depolymerans]|uniref:Uncharacterized protein n=1 Tax=Roseateles depolymerans TaxID=76731 RepID=A0A0U3MZX4_9BURK|nr:hypothetical protein [Roseateles depolymerans]ALV05515.1 hypothetical protein RD2015_1021 [Roseateles depolymerans]REG14466.1 hypothetical protein DES44_2962 [Roseateles depolymerans]
MSELSDWHTLSTWTDTTVLLRLCEVVLATSLIELLWFLTRRPAGPPGLVPNVLAGVSLVLALRLGLGGAGVLWVAACLAAAGVSHLFDLRARWRRPVVSPPLRRQRS